MSEFTCEHIKPSNSIILYNGSKQVGLLDFNGPVMTFEGDADESAKVFFDLIADRFAQRMSEKREWVGLTDEDMDCLFPHGSSVWVQETVKIIEAKLKEKNHD